MAEVVAFIARFDLASVSLAGKQLRKICEKHACTLRLWEIDYAGVISFRGDMHCDFSFTYQARDEQFSLDSNSAKEIIPVAMRNVVVEQCRFQCVHAVEMDGCILRAFSEIADRVVITGELSVLGKCFDSTETLLAFVAKFRYVRVLHISPYYKVQWDIEAIRGFCKQNRIQSCAISWQQII